MALCSLLSLLSPFQNETFFFNLSWPCMMALHLNNDLIQPTNHPIELPFPFAQFCSRLVVSSTWQRVIMWVNFDSLHHVRVVMCPLELLLAIHMHAEITCLHVIDHLVDLQGLKLIQDHVWELTLHCCHASPVSLCTILSLFHIISILAPGVFPMPPNCFIFVQQTLPCLPHLLLRPL